MPINKLLIQTKYYSKYLFFCFDSMRKMCETSDDGVTSNKGSTEEGQSLQLAVLSQPYLMNHKLQTLVLDDAHDDLMSISLLQGRRSDFFASQCAEHCVHCTHEKLFQKSSIAPWPFCQGGHNRFAMGLTCASLLRRFPVSTIVSQKHECWDYDITNSTHTHVVYGQRKHDDFANIMRTG